MAKASLRILEPAFVGSFFALIAAILAFLTLLTGRHPGDLLLFKVNVEDFRIPSKLSSSQLLSDIEPVPGDDLTSAVTTADSLALAQYYTIHILTYCGHFKDGRKFCSDARIGWWFDPVEILKLDEAGLSGKFSEEFVNAVKSYKHGANFIGTGFIVAFIATALALVLSLFAKRHRGLNIVVATFASIGSAFLLADALTTMTAARRMVKAINNDLGHVGMEAANGSLVYLPFIAAALSLIASITYSTIAHRNRTSNARLQPSTQRKSSTVADHLIAPNEGTSAFRQGQSLLQRVSTWSRGSYVRIDKQRPNGRLMDSPISEQSSFLSPADEVRFDQNTMYRDHPSPRSKSPSEQSLDSKLPSEQNDNDFAMQPLTRRSRSPGDA